MKDDKVEVLQRNDRPACMRANGKFICYCGKCKPEDYPLPRFIKIDPLVFKDLKYAVKLPSLGRALCCCGYTECTDPECRQASHN